MVTITYETEDETGQTFAHIRSDSGVIGHAMELRRIPRGTWVTIPPNLQPTITKYLVKKCGFSYIMRYPIEDVEHDVLLKE
ncbi:MAG TPA: hypothetical protein VJ508_04340 [Saprospiraceae bacterium]|nr:hypothetical protein [Saprospiraceae bacterium]